MNPLFGKDCPIFGIFDLEQKDWVLDCFDDPRVFLTPESAEKYRTNCVNYNSTRFEVREWTRPIS